MRLPFWPSREHLKALADPDPDPDPDPIWCTDKVVEWRRAVLRRIAAGVVRNECFRQPCSNCGQLKSTGRVRESVSQAEGFKSAAP